MDPNLKGSMDILGCRGCEGIFEILCIGIGTAELMEMISRSLEKEFSSYPLAYRIKSQMECVVLNIKVGVPLVGKMRVRQESRGVLWQESEEDDGKHAEFRSRLVYALGHDRCPSIARGSSFWRAVGRTRNLFTQRTCGGAPFG